MARINLSPWREEVRAEDQRQFLVAIVGFAIVGALYVFMADRVADGWIDTQQARNSYLSAEIATLEDKIKEIEQLKEKRDQLVERMRVIQELQGNRPVIVHIFDELVRKLPDGVYLTAVESQGEVVSIAGAAESNNRISSLMRQLDSSSWFDEPNLTSVKADDEEGATANLFDLSVKRIALDKNGQEG